MTATNREKELYGGGVEIVHREDDCTVYRLANDNGDAVMTSYEVFPGIALVHTRQYSIDQAEVGDVIEINQCREGQALCANWFAGSEQTMSPGKVGVVKDGVQVPHIHVLPVAPLGTGDVS